MNEVRDREGRDNSRSTNTRVRRRNPKIDVILEVYLDPIESKVEESLAKYHEWRGSMDEADLNRLEKHVERLVTIYREERDNIIGWRNYFIARLLKQDQEETNKQRND